MRLTMKYGLKQSTLAMINSVFANYPNVKMVILYGSRAKGNYRSGSDIDLTLVGENLNLSLLWKIENELDDLLQPYKIDLSIRDQIDNPNLLAHIERFGKVFYELEKVESK